MDGVTVFLSFVEGILTFISPCILPLLPVYFVYLAGSSGDNKDSFRGGSGRLLSNSIGFVVGFAVVFVLLGATATTLGSFLKSHIELFRRASGIVMIIFGLNFIGILKISFLNAEKRLNYEFNELKFFKSILFGMVFGFGWTPCLGAFLGSALLMAGNQDTVFRGILLLLVYSIGLGIPFIVTAIIFEKLKNAFRWIQKHNRIINFISGIVLILAGILVFTDNLKTLY